MANIDITDQGSTLNNGVLQLENGVAMDTTLRYVADQNNTKSQLLLATNATTIEGTLKIKTSNVEYLDVEDALGNNRFTISKAVGSQKVDLDFASNPTSPTDIVGGIRTFQDGVNLSDSLFFRKNGQATFTERVNVEGDSSVITQTSSVIASTTTNANLVIAPNGTGALVASIPDGTTTGGNLRGANAVDLQMVRSAAANVASGTASFVVGGFNSASNQYAIAMGQSNSVAGQFGVAIGANNSVPVGSSVGVAIGNGNTSSADGSVAIGRNNTASSNFSTISGGQSNTASTGTHATVVGGQSNTSSGAHSVSGGSGNTASGGTSLSIGLNNIASTESSIALGRGNTAAGVRRNYAIGENNTVTGYDGSAALGQGNNVSGVDTAIAIGRANTISGTTSFGFGNGNSVTANESYAFGKSNIIGSGLSIALGVGNNVNVTPANSSMVAIGFNHKTSGSFSTSIGNRSWAYLYGQIAHAAEWFSVNNDWGNAQQSTLLARRESTLTTGATTTLSLDGTGTTNLIIPLDSNRMWNVQVRWVAVVTAITGTAAGVTVGDTKTSTDLLAVAKRAGSTTVSAHTSAGTHAIETVAGSLAAANIAYSAGASQEMAITFTGPTFAGGGSVTMRVVAAISLTEVAY